MNGSVVSEEDGRDRGGNASQGKSLPFAECNLDNYKQQRSSFWVRLRKKRTRRGVVEVDVDHHRFPTLTALKIGIRRIVEDCPHLSAKECVEYEDCRHVHEERIPLPGGKECVFRSLGSAVFASLRRAMEVSEPEFLEALASPSLPFLEFLSNSKSGQDFFFSNNQKFMLKTERPKCINHFYNMLWDYIQHLLMYPHSLLVKFLGLYSIKMPGLKTKYFMVMQSVFYPVSLIQDRFDLKGCTAGRYQPPKSSSGNELTVLKDVNFLKNGVHIDLGVQREWFRRQLLIDTEFLKRVGVLDYSLLVARQPLPVSASHQSLPTVVTRVTRSVTKYSTCGQSVSPHAADATANALEDSCDSSEGLPVSPRRHKGRSNTVAPLHSEGTRTPRANDMEGLKPHRKAIIKEEQSEADHPCEGGAGCESSDTRGRECDQDRVEPLNLLSALREHGAADAGSDEPPKHAVDYAWTSAEENAGTSGEPPETYHPFEDHGARVAWGRTSDRGLSATKARSVRPTPPSTASDVIICTPRTDAVSSSKNSRPKSVSQVSQSRSEATTFSLEMQSLPGSAVDRPAPPSATMGTNPRQSVLSRQLGTLKDIEAENRRLLPNCENALHIIDGPHDRYYVGLVDFFTSYQCWQRTARYVKAVRYRSRDHSTLPPKEYADRLVRFVFSSLH